MGTGFKTALVAALVMLFGAMQGMDWLTLTNDPQITGWIVTGIGMAMAILRYMTDSPIFQSRQSLMQNVR